MIFGLVTGVLVIALASVIAAGIVRPALVLTPGTMRIIRAFGAVRVPVQEITGVGLVFQRLRPGSRGPATGWWMMVWHGDERGELVPLGYLPLLRSRRDPRAREKFLAVSPMPVSGDAGGRFSLDKFDVATETDPAKLEATYAARAAHEIYQRVMAQQGPTGPLAVTQRQRHVHIGSPPAAVSVLAFWSPEGVMGRAEPDSSGDHDNGGQALATGIEPA